jgi:hypothetical protein
MTRHARAGRFVFVIAASIGSNAFAQGGPPLLTDDPGTPGDGHWEINLAWTAESARGARESELPLADINYGLGDRMQLKFEMPWVVAHGGTASANGFGDALAGVKWRFFDEGEHGWQISTYPQIGFLLPGLHHANAADRGVSYLLPIEIQRDLGPIDANIELGRAWASSGVGSRIAGIALGRTLSERFELVGELHDEAEIGSGAHELVAAIGARGVLSEHFTLLASVGRDLENTIGPDDRVISYLGLQIHL